MRTLSEGIRKIVHGHLRPYFVSADISFWYDWHGGPCLADPPIETLRQAIIGADRKNPWHDSPDTSDASEGARNISNGVVERTVMPFPCVSCGFTVTPALQQLRKGQLHAYEKYVMGLGAELAALKIPGVDNVSAVSRFSRVKRFKVT